jgi:hypothetical protein
MIHCEKKMADDDGVELHEETCHNRRRHDHAERPRLPPQGVVQRVVWFAGLGFPAHALAHAGGRPDISLHWQEKSARDSQVCRLGGRKRKRKEKRNKKETKKKQKRNKKETKKKKEETKSQFLQETVGGVESRKAR